MNNQILGYLNAKDFGACGSKFETTAHTTENSNVVVLDDIGDFEVGQEIKIKGALPRHECFRLFGPNGVHFLNRDIVDEIKIRGWNGNNGDHVPYIIDIPKESNNHFRWTDDLGRTWHEDVKMTFGWQPISSGLEVSFSDFEWEKGWIVVFVMRSSLVARITEIEGNTITIDKEATRTADDLAQHSDTSALNAAIAAAVESKCNLYIPNGHYRLSDTLYVNNPTSITIKGESPENTILDIGDGSVGVEDFGGSCLFLNGGDECNLYNLGFRGGMGFKDIDIAGHMKTKGTTGLWGFYLKKSNALCVRSTERVYVENCHAKRMSAECFFSCGEYRMGSSVPEKYTKTLSFVRCSVEDCARNAFNNNDLAENTHLIDCRVVDVGGCCWEGASRFVNVRGCYFRNCGTMAIGNIRMRKPELESLGSGQHVVSDNVFEDCCSYGLSMIGVGACATQVIIKANSFINFNSDAILVSADTGTNDLPCQNIIITGNSFDMTAENSPSKKRFAISIAADAVTVSDNQIFANTKDNTSDANLTAIVVRDDAQYSIIHDNMIKNCGGGIETARCPGQVGEVIDDTSFLRDKRYIFYGAPPVPRVRASNKSGWIIKWTDGSVSVIEKIDAETGVFKLREPRKLTSGEFFYFYPPMTIRNIHDNMIY